MLVAPLSPPNMVTGHKNPRWQWSKGPKMQTPDFKTDENKSMGDVTVATDLLTDSKIESVCSYILLCIQTFDLIKRFSHIHI